MMTKIDFKDVLKLARAAHSIPALRSVVFDGKSAIAAGSVDWFAGVPCPQDLAAPVVVPVEALAVHLAKSRHLIVTPDGLTNGQGLVTAFDKKFDYDVVLDLLPQPPGDGVERVAFGLDLDALDRVLVAAGKQDSRYYLNGVMMDLSCGDLVGTDGHRLHCYRNRVPVPFKRKVVDGVPQGDVVQVILAGDPLDWIVRSADASARVTVWNPRRKAEKFGAVPALLQAGDGFVFIRNAIDGKYVDHHRVIPAPTSQQAWVTLDPVAMAEAAGAMGRAYATRHEGKYSPAGVDFGAGRVHAGPDADYIPVPMTLHPDLTGPEFAATRDDLWATFNSVYLQDVADCVTPAAQWRFPLVNTANHPLAVFDGDFVGVVMPTRESRPGLAARMPQDAPEPAGTAQEGPEPAGTAQEGPEPAETAQEGPEPCPAAVASLAAQLVHKVSRPAAGEGLKKTRKAPKGEPVPA